MLLWALLSTSSSVSKAQPLDPSQQYITGNVVQSTVSGTTPWVNGVYQSELTCWAWGDPGYCGPNAIVRPGNLINFSYGSTDLYQSQSVASLLPNSGTGLQINGFVFGFMAKNGNGWDDGRTDSLNAYVQFFGSNNALVKNYNYNLNYNFNWTNFNFNETFLSPIGVNQLSNVRYGFIGRDNNFWAGPYGPEISDVSFSLKYSVDPCSVNVLSSPACPGYLTELAKLTPPAPVVSEPIVASPTTVEIAQPVQQNSNPIASVSVIEQEKKSGPSTSQILSIIKNIQQNDAAVQKSAVQNALSEASSVSLSSQQEALSIANQSQSASIAAANQLSLTSSLNVVPNGTFSGITTNNSLNTSALRGQEIELPQTENKFLTNRTDPINQILDSKAVEQVESSSNQSISVKRNVPNNELAGAVNIASLNVVPPGFDLYSMTLKDAPFYAPKEIYKNQNVVDNERLLRQLNNRSDALHREMVNQQYR